MKKLLSIVLAVTLLLTSVLVAVPVTAATVPEGFTAIDSLDDITAAGKYYLTKDLVGSEKNTKALRAMYSNTVIDGGGHTIEVDMDAALYNWAANITVKNIKFTGVINVGSGKSCVGVLSNGWDQGVTLENVESSVNINVNNTTARVGGLVGKVQNNGQVSMTNVVNRGTITVAEGVTVDHLGGLIGYFGNTYNDEFAKNIIFNNCANEGDIVVNGMAKNVGGFIGYSEGDRDTSLFTVSGGYNSGNITVAGAPVTTVHVAGLAGLIDEVTAGLTVSIDRFTNNGNIAYNNTKCDASQKAFVAGVVANTDANITVSNCTNTGELSTAKGASEPNVGGIVARVIAANATIKGCKNTGNISSGNTQPSGSYPHVGYGGILGAFDAETYSNAPAANVNNALKIDNCYNKGNVTAHDGSYSTQAAGIVGRLYRTASMTVTNCINEGTVTSKTPGGWSTVGGIAGGIVTLGHPDTLNKGGTLTITNCHNFGALLGIYAGGIFGSTFQSGSRDDGEININISYCTNNSTGTGKVYAENWAGGIIGYLTNVTSGASGVIDNTNISYCGNYGHVAGQWEGGGIIGASKTSAGSAITIDHCFNAGKVEGTSDNSHKAAGIIRICAVPTLTITNCVNTGATGSNNRFPIAPQTAHADIIDTIVASGNTYVAKQADNADSGAHGTLVDANTAKASIEAIEKAIFERTDATNPSAMIFSEAQWRARPRHSTNTDTTTVFGGDVYLMKDITVSTYAGQHKDGTIFGQGHTVTFSGDSTLVGYGENVAFRDLVLKGTITSARAGGHVGPLSRDGIAGHMDVINVTSDVDIIVNAAAGNVGGLLGKTGNTSYFENVDWTGSITFNAAQAKQVGGFVGVANNVQFVDCTSAGAFTFNTAAALGAYSGCIVGETRNAAFTNCKNNTNVTFPTAMFFGGFAGVAFSGTLSIINCENNGDITMQALNNNQAVLGGFVGYCDTDIEIKDSLNSGDITMQSTSVDSSRGAGGLIGDSINNHVVSINNCINTGNVSVATAYAGGIAGQAKGTVSIVDCVNVGNVKTIDGGGVVAAGGIVGQYQSNITGYSKIDQCVNAGKVSLTKGSNGRGCDSYALVGGILGSAASKVDITNCIHMGQMGTGASESNVAGTFPMTNLLESTYKPSDKKHNDVDFLNALVIDSAASGGKASNLYLEGTANQTSCKPYPDSTVISGAENIYKRSISATKAEIAAKLEANRTIGFSTTSLEAEIADFATHSEADYTKASWAPYAASLAAAQTALGSYNSAKVFERFQYTLAKAEVDLAAKEAALVTKTVFYTDINSAIAAAKAKVEADYTVATWSVLAAALANAESAVANETEDKVAEYTTALNTAINGLVTKTVFYADINAAISAAKAKVEADYTVATWNTLATALANAENAVSNENEGKVAEYTTALNTAINGLVSNAAIKTAIALVPAGGNSDGKYTITSWNAMQAKLTAANTAMAEATTIEAVNTAASELTAAVNALVTKEDFYAAIRTAINTAKAKVEADYTVATWNALAAALANAESAVANETEDKVAEYTTALNNAIDGLVSTAAIKSAIALVPAGDNSDGTYTTSTWNAMQAKLTAANTAMAEATTVEAVNTAASELTAAIDALITKEELYADVIAAINTAKAKVEADYTVATWNTLSTALANAENVIDSENEAQIEVCAAALNNAINGLVPTAAIKSAIALVPAGNNSNGMYTAASWSILQAKLTAANTAMAEATTVAAVTTAANELTAAVEALVLTEIVTALENKITSALLLVEGDYTVATWEEFANALAAAQDAVANSTHLESVLLAADTSLVNAVEGLINIKALKEALVEYATDIEGSFYVESTWTPYAEALANANSALTASEQSVVDAAVEALAKTYADLELLPVSEEKVEEVVEEIVKGEALNPEYYDEHTYNNFMAKVEEVKQVLVNPNATQHEVSVALKQLEEAKENLVRVNATDDDLVALEEAITAADAIHGEGVFVDTTWNTLVEKLNTAKSLMETSLNASVAKEDVIVAAAELLDAIENLVENPEGMSIEEQIALRIEALSERDRIAFNMMLKREPVKDIKTMLILLAELEAN